MSTVAIRPESPRTVTPFGIRTGGDCHSYEGRPGRACEQLTPGPLPRPEIVRRSQAIDGYAARPPIRAAVAI